MPSTREPPDQGPSPESKGEWIGSYEILGRLGAGGAGEVLLAYDQRLERQVAIKRILLDKDVTDQERRRFLREARAVAGLSHPSIVQLYEILEHRDSDALVMEYVEGETLAARLRRDRLDLLLALRLASEVAEALSEAHSKGIIHRDLKSENVMVTAYDHAKVVDFGLAKLTQRKRSEDDPSLTEKGTILGTFRSMAPEQASGNAVDERADLFSLGVLLYEMLTGTSPFLGANALQTLTNVVQRRQPPVRVVRAEVPVALSELIERLLEKDPRDRPPSAAKVTRELGRILSRETASRHRDGPDAGAFDDDATAPAIPAGAPTAGRAVARAAGAGEGRRESRRPGARRRWIAVVAALLLSTLAAAIFFLRQPPRLRVAVLAPQLPENDAACLELVAAAVLEGSIQTLIALEGISPVDPKDVGPISGGPVDVARAVAADQVLSSTIEANEGLAQVALRKVAGEDGEILWTETLQVPRSPDDARLVAEGVGTRLREAYPRNSLSDDVPRLEVRQQDYADFLRVKLRIDEGNVPLEPELEELERILEGSPRFLPGWLAAAKAAILLFRDNHRPDYMHQAGGLLERARSLAPTDPRPLYEDFRLSLETGESQRAEGILAELEHSVPHDLMVPESRARLAEYQGDLKGAIEAMHTVIERRPSWRYLYRIAFLEFEHGEVSAARAHLKELLERAPGNTWGLGMLVQLELLYGDLERAEKLALELVEIKRHRSYFSNLGLVRYLLRRYEDAKVSYIEALEIEPNSPVVLLNLGDAESALGHLEAANALYRQVLEELGHMEAEAELSVADKMRSAQCLAHLGETRRAAELTLEALRQHGNSAEIASEAALVYALIGDRASALAQVSIAIERNVDRRWFEIPGFSSLQRDQEFLALLDSASGAR